VKIGDVVRGGETVLGRLGARAGTMPAPAGRLADEEGGESPRRAGRYEPEDG
jgi:hypothetical protein